MSLLLTGAGGSVSAAAPVLVSAVVNTSGGSIILTFAPGVADVDGGTWTLTADGGPIPALFPTPPVGYYTAWMAVLFGTITAGQVCLLSYTPGNVRDSMGVPLVGFADAAVTNNSTA